MTTDRDKHYVTAPDGTVWPVSVGDLEWTQRYGRDEEVINQRMIIASVVATYQTLLDPVINQKTAFDKLRRARYAQLEANRRSTITELVPWHESVGRWLTDQVRITMVHHEEDHTWPTVYTDRGFGVSAVGGMVEVLRYPPIEGDGDD